MANKKYEMRISARTAFLPEHSDAGSGRYVFAYTITITNTGTVAAQLLARHWIVTDAHNRVQEVRGLGVVGEQPLIRPNESFQYTSCAAIATPSGSMRGSYRMRAEDGVEFDAPIPEFTLARPNALH
jgi:ApaG protein